MNTLPQYDATKTNAEQGLYAKFSVTRSDGRDAPGGDRHGARYFVLDLDHDAHAKPALLAYIEACEDDYPVLAEDLRAQVDRLALGTFVTVPETILPGGTVVPAFAVSQYLCSQHQDGHPWVEIDYHRARAACKRASVHLLTERQALAIAHDVAAQDINWSGGKVGEGKLYQGLHKGTVPEAQGHDHEPTGDEERRWLQLSNGERIYDFAGNAYQWIFDDVQGDDAGLVAKAFAAESPSIQAPYPSREKGMGWRPDAGTNWSGNALFRGGYWRSGSYAGAFCLNRVWPGVAYDYVGFRCTK